MEMVLMEELQNLVEQTQRFTQAKLTGKAQARLEMDMELFFKAQHKLFLKGFARFETYFEESVTPKDLDGLFMQIEDKTEAKGATAITKGAAKSMKGGGTAALASVGIKGSFDLSSPFATGYLSSVGGAQITKINETTRKNINRILTQSIDEGWSYNKTAKAIGEKYSEMWIGKPQQHIASRAHFIAVTETGNAYMEGRITSMHSVQAQGLPMEKYWSTMKDDRVSDGCIENEDAGWIPLRKFFPSTHDRPLRFPGCRCDLLFQVAKKQEVTDVGYRDYESNDAIIDNFNPAYQDWSDAIPDTQEWAIQEYTDGSYHEMNGYLRRGATYDDIAEFDEDMGDVAKWLQDAIDASPPSPEDIVLHRGFGSEDLWNAISDGNLDIGDIIEEKQFLSTSVSASNARGFRDSKFGIEYRIHTPQGSKFAYVDNLSQHAGEFEAILAPGTQLEILNVTSEFNEFIGQAIHTVDVLLK